jgi:hypothetical protein
VSREEVEAEGTTITREIYLQPHEDDCLAFEAASRRPAFHTSPQSRHRQYVVASEVLLVVSVFGDRHCGQLAAG